MENLPTVFRWWRLSDLFFLPNRIYADANITVAAFTVVAATIGTAIGCFADRLPGGQPDRNAHTASHRQDS